jgi:EAL domain-containing protein (putative c-di-GMP-specific phosphodiesterase class I)/GGDEF domain-containing protein
VSVTSVPSSSSVATVAIHSQDPRVVGRFAVTLAGAPELQMVRVEVEEPPRLALIDDRLENATALVDTETERGVTCLIVTDGADVDRIVALLGAGADGCLRRDVDATDLRAGLAAATRGTFQLPRAIGHEVVARAATGRHGDGPASAAAPAPLVELIRDVIARRRFELVFQPIVDLRTGEITAVESLARFSPEPIQPPNVWLGMADEAGLRVELEHELLRAAVETLDRLPDPMSLEVNLSPGAAMDAGLSEALEGVALERVVVEITDHRQLDDYEPLSEALATLRRGGLRVAVDDSGQGISSLQQIAKLAPSFMKLNRTLTRNIDRDPTKHALAYAVSTFVASHDAAIVAEGLETEAELHTLRALGAPFAQGYLLERPKPLDELDLTQPIELPAYDGDAPQAPTAPGLELRGAANEDFREAIRQTLRFLGEQHPTATFVVAHLDYMLRRHTVLAAAGPIAYELPPGESTRLEDTMCFHMTSRDGSRLCPDISADTVYESLAFAKRLEAASYMGAPLELPDGTRFGALFAVSRSTRAFGPQDLALIDAASAVLGAVLVRQTEDMDRGTLLRFVRRLARMDGLTGALNAPGFDEMLADELRRPAARRRGAYVGIEIEGLGSLAQQYGRHVGDLVVKDVASAVAASAEELDVLGRVGESRFGVLLICNPPDVALPDFFQSLASRISEAASRRGVTIAVRAGSARLAELEEPEQAWDRAAAAAVKLV